MNFKQLGLNSAILKALEAQGYQTPTPIQSGAIPPALIGRDVLGIAQTGTGKTCAFATPILQRLALAPRPEKRVIRSLILTPTRELALQIQESFEHYGANLPLKSTVIFGGVGQQPQVDKLRRGVDILVATPGRLLDLHGQGLLDLAHIEIFVLDEADRMLDMGFIHDVKRVLKLLPEKKQTLFFSATMPPEVQSLVDGLLHDPAKVTVTPVSSPVEIIDQSLYFVDKPNKSKLLAHLVTKGGVKNALVFSRTKHGANKIASDLMKAGISAAAIHGNKSQTARVQALSDFKTGKIRVLAATDIAARGLDIEELSHVFNYNLPDVPETYVHRIGRTGRAGKGGTAISFCDISEKDELKAIEKLLGKKIPVVEDHPWPMTNFDPPKRDKNGKIINPEDAEARQAARERKRERAEAKKEPVKPAAKEPVKPAAKKPAADTRSPKEKRASAGYSPQGGRRIPKAAEPPRAAQKPSKTLDEALTAVAPKAPAGVDRDAFEKWMAEERRIQAQQGYTSALEGEEIMDATARLLAPKRPAAPARPAIPERVTAKREEPRKAQPQKGKAQPQKSQPPKAKPARPEKPVKAQPKVEKPAPAPKAEKRGLFGKKSAPVSTAPQPRPVSKAPAAKAADAALEERKAKIRAQAKARRAQGHDMAPKSGAQKDSTQQDSLMRPYYLNDD